MSQCIPPSGTTCADGLPPGGSPPTTARKPPSTTKQITKQERYDWHHHVGIVRRGKEVLANVAEALMQIRDRELWRAQYDNWDAFVGGELDFSKRRANQIIAAAKVMAALPSPDSTPKPPPNPTESAQVGTRVPTWPANERQARELSRLGNDDREAQSEAFAEACKSADGEQPTVAQIKSVVDAVLEDRPLDGMGQRVPRTLRETFLNREKLLRAANALSQAAKFVKETVGYDGGEIVTECGTWSRIKAIRARLAQEQAPFCLCPDCDGDTPDRCARCTGRGWQTKNEMQLYQMDAEGRP